MAVLDLPDLLGPRDRPDQAGHPVLLGRPVHLVYPVHLVPPARLGLTDSPGNLGQPGNLVYQERLEYLTHPSDLLTPAFVGLAIITRKINLTSPCLCETGPRTGLPANEEEMRGMKDHICALYERLMILEGVIAAAPHQAQAIGVPDYCGIDVAQQQFPPTAGKPQDGGFIPPTDGQYVPPFGSNQGGKPDYDGSQTSWDTNLIPDATGTGDTFVPDYGYEKPDVGGTQQPYDTSDDGVPDYSGTEPPYVGPDYSGTEPPYVGPDYGQTDYGQPDVGTDAPVVDGTDYGTPELENVIPGSTDHETPDESQPPYGGPDYGQPDGTDYGQPDEGEEGDSVDITDENKPDYVQPDYGQPDDGVDYGEDGGTEPPYTDYDGWHPISPQEPEYEEPQEPEYEEPGSGDDFQPDDGIIQVLPPYGGRPGEISPDQSGSVPSQVIPPILEVPDRGDIPVHHIPPYIVPGSEDDDQQPDTNTVYEGGLDVEEGYEESSGDAETGSGDEYNNNYNGFFSFSDFFNRRAK
ncbi:hypothetical protein Bbelb_173930 [Branchiostoma belcheri]|nr:hypothetical protein Bbelb_173930 [Branchiostoma belcheri]